jgi:NAD-dependent deacetylase
LAKLQEVVQLIMEKKNVVAFTGAGISVDAGIPAFRGGQGLWQKYDPMEYAEIRAFHRNPEKAWTMLREMSEVILGAEPSPAHKALSVLEREGFLRAVITQNIDGLHQSAGNTNVIEYHGSHRTLRCLTCAEKIPLTKDSLVVYPFPICRRCHAAMKPDVVFFGEQIPMEAISRANHEAQACNIMMIIGTSGVVYPAADIPFMAASSGATIVEINVEPTPFTSSITNHFFEGSASSVLPDILGQLGMIM